MKRNLAVPVLAFTLVALGAMAALGAEKPAVEISSPATVADSALSAPGRARPGQTTIFMRAEGERQGLIEGGSTRRGQEGWIEVWGWSHEVVSPRDAASGLPTGKRQHKPLTITKPIDKATPLLMNALVNNENLTEVELRFFRSDAKGTEQHYFTIKLQNASVAGIRHENNTGVAVETQEHVSFTYQKITWTWEDGGITAEDDWETPVG